MEKLKLIVVNEPNDEHKEELLKEISEFIQENYYSQKEVIKMKRKVKINKFNILVLITAIISTYFVAHDFIFLGIKPLFTGKLICLTYTGILFDICAIFMLDASYQIIEGWLK